MKDLPRVTLVAVSSIKIAETIRAMKKSMTGLHFHEALLLTDVSVAPALLEDSGIKVVPIEHLDYEGYSFFMLYKLKGYIQTDFALVVQYDGYVIHPDEWRDAFLKYDYIGAPWPKDIHFDTDGANVRVGNGGFSLRSKKLLWAPTELGLPFIDGGTGYFNEDGNICVYHRGKLEKSGIRFAPVEAASLFSREKTCDDSYDRPFGFHGERHRPAGWAPRAAAFITSLGRFAGKAARKTRYESNNLFTAASRGISSAKNDLTPHISLAEYRKAHKVYDVFTFFNELDLLEMRLNILDPYVDHFVIVEATETFSGKPKPLVYEKNKERFRRWHHKIIHHVTRDVPKGREELEQRLRDSKGLSDIDRKVIDEVLSHSTTGPHGVDWTKEFYQKESLKKPLAGLADDDICVVSDVDEIWDPSARIDYSKDCIFKLRQKMYAYYLNNRSSEPWVQPIVTKYKNISDACLNELRSEKKTRCVYVRNGGWHFTNMGGADQIRRKIESYGHREFDTAEIKSKIEKMMSENKDFIGRKFRFWVDESDLPQYILDNKEKYKEYFK